MILNVFLINAFAMHLTKCKILNKKLQNIKGKSLIRHPLSSLQAQRQVEIPAINPSIFH